MVNSSTPTTGSQTQKLSHTDVSIAFLAALQAVAELAASEPGNMNEANATLGEIEDRAQTVLLRPCRHSISVIDEENRHICVACGRDVYEDDKA